MRKSTHATINCRLAYSVRDRNPDELSADERIIGFLALQSKIGRQDNQAGNIGCNFHIDRIIARYRWFDPNHIVLGDRGLTGKHSESEQTEKCGF